MLQYKLMLIFTLLSLVNLSWATNSPATTPAANQTSAANTQAPLRQPTTTAQRHTPASTATTPAASITTLQQKHKQELAQQQSRLTLLEQANQKALAQNQELQLKNDNLAVQVQVLQSERSAQMFLYGAATFGSGIFVGILIYNILYTRRRRQW